MKTKIDPADTNFSLYVRSKDKWRCQRCGKQYVPPTSALHCSHFFSRGKWNVRFDEFNATSLCFGCHIYLDHHKDEYRQFKINQIGQAEFDKLEVRANTYAKKDWQLARMYTKQLLESL